MAATYRVRNTKSGRKAEIIGYASPPKSPPNVFCNHPTSPPIPPCSTLYLWVAVIPLGSYDEIAWEKKKARSPEGGREGAAFLPSLSARKEGSEAGNWPDMVQFGKHFHVRRREREADHPHHPFRPKAKMGKEKHPHKNHLAASKV